MSYLAIGSVTKSIAELLARKLNKPPLMGANVTLRVTTLPPDDTRVDEADGVNLFLYRVSESAFSNNIPWRGERPTPIKTRRPPLALNLHYLLTAYAKKGDGTAQDDITAHQILGNALSILHENAILNDVHDSEFDADVNTNFAEELRKSFEKIIISPMPISMEEFSKIWTGLSKAYRLSVAYEVSLVQIGPLSSPQPPAPPIHKTTLAVNTIGRPQIGSISPASGPVLTDVTIKGSGFKTRGMATTVRIGERQFTEAELIKLTANEIVIKIPEAPRPGPNLPVVVAVSKRESDPVNFEVKPWIQSVSPFRGVTKIPITIPFDPAGAAVAATVGAAAATANVDTAKKLVSLIVPDGIANGPQFVVLTLTPGGRTNAQIYEVIPLILTAIVTADVIAVKTTIVITGSRLAGSDVKVKYGKLLINKGQNAAADGLTVEVPRVLPTTEPVSVLVDGRESNLLPPQITGIDPPEAFPGEQIRITGAGLSGEAVTVRFGATNVPLGPVPFSSQIDVAVPDTLAVGVTVAVRVVVNTIESNPKDLKVVA